MLFQFSSAGRVHQSLDALVDGIAEVRQVDRNDTGVGVWGSKRWNKEVQNLGVAETSGLFDVDICGSV